MLNVHFKNTDAAIAYGQKIRGNQEKIDGLKDLRAYYVGRVSLLLVQGKEAEALHLASGQSQLTREAIEEAEKVTV